jgi:trigger factor
VKSAVEKLSPTRVKLTIDLEFTELAPHIKDAYQSISEKIVIPGFRKGKVPQAMIDQRVGRGSVLDEAINAALPVFYSQAVREHEVLVVGRPNVDITELEDNKKVAFTVEVEVRPEIDLPDFSKISVKVDDVAVTEKDIEEQVDSLRARFGTLTAVEKDAATGDFVSIDLVAKVDGKEIEGGSANGISYEVGSGKMIEGLDEVLVGLKVEDQKTFNAPLVGMAEGEIGEVTVTLKAVKTRELPELNDEFAKLASEFDTLTELRADVSERLTRLKSMEQGAQARDLLVQQLLDTLEIPIPEGIVEEEVTAHLEKENRLDDTAHRAEVIEEVKKSLATEFLLDAIVRAENVQVSEAELTEYLIRSSARYGMAPEQFVQEISKSGQITSVVADVSRTKALAVVLEQVAVEDASGRKVDLEALRPKPEIAEPTE